MLHVQIRIKGHIDESWGDWLGGLVIKRGERQESLLEGDILDQAALYGLLARLRDLGLSLVSVTSTEVVVPG